ncbi:App1 family protein [Deinococcus alpinitundrae]|uniref:App1 family protein n=1 Tax=Deinococcus alpinitundrae TaxID=468913 RepID=UPI00137A7F05|nr:phosphatase domain-containing protein [Deinococcus alpinitundrae]
MDSGQHTSAQGPGPLEQTRLLSRLGKFVRRQLSLKQLGRLLQPTFERLLALADTRFSAFIQPRRRRGDIIITPYTGWGTPQHLELTGRVLLPRTLAVPKRGDPRWRNFVGILRRLLSREVGGVIVYGVLEGQTVSAVSDTGGYFTLTWERPEVAAATPDAGGWLEASLSIEGRSKKTFAQVRVVRRPRFGIISDLDDTVLKSDVTSLPQMLGTVLTGNARTRLPFPGVSALYRALVREKTGTNPIFYVSSSPWNFYDLLWTFLKYRRLPLGPIFLRDWGAELFSGGGHHKHTIIERLMKTYPALPFVLIGDSGEQDPEIYAEVVRRNPGRVLAVYIRRVTGAARDEGVQQLRAEVQKAGVELVLTRDSLAAAFHAMAMNLISPSELRSVIQSVEKSFAQNPLAHNPFAPSFPAPAAASPGPVGAAALDLAPLIRRPRRS